MKVILKDDVKNLGKMGDVIAVSDGYARNYLIPHKLAVVLDTKNLKELEHHKKVVQQKAAKLRDEAKSLSEKLSQASVTIKAKAGEEDKLFGSVTAMDIAESLKDLGFAIDKKKIIIDEPIKRLGSYTVNVKLHSDFLTQVKVNVEQE